jgi:hypothetical protein
MQSAAARNEPAPSAKVSVGGGTPASGAKAKAGGRKEK